jgi:replicative DNA helicase
MVEAMRADATGERYSWGIPRLDSLTRGVRDGRLTIIAGPTHGGKSMLAMRLVLSNPRTRFLWASPDEGSQYVLQKLIGAFLGMNEGDVEEMLADRDPAIEEVVREITSRVWITDVTTTLGLQEEANAAEKEWGEQPDVVIYDYIDCLTGCFSTTERVAKLKGFATKNNVSMVALHQSNKTGLNKKFVPSLEDMKESGHAESFLVVWVKRPYVDPDSAYEVQCEERQASGEVYVLKAKGGGRTSDSPVRIAITPGAVAEGWNDDHRKRAEGKV